MAKDDGLGSYQVGRDTGMSDGSFMGAVGQAHYLQGESDRQQRAWLESQMPRRSGGQLSSRRHVGFFTSICCALLSYMAVYPHYDDIYRFFGTSVHSVGMAILAGTVLWTMLTALASIRIFRLPLHVGGVAAFVLLVVEHAVPAL